MKCNACWKELSHETAFITSCSHIYCEVDARRIFSKDRLCPLCDTSLTSRNSINGVELVVDDSKVLQLCGLHPKEILEICNKAISFWDFQKQIEIEFQRSEAKKALISSQRIEKTFNDKMLEAANEINTLKHKIASITEEMKNDKKELAELQEKFTEANRQKRKLAELYEQAKKERDPSAARLSIESFSGSNHSLSLDPPLSGSISPSSNIESLSSTRQRGLSDLDMDYGKKDLGMKSGDNQYKDRFAMARKADGVRTPVKSPGPRLPLNSPGRSNSISLPTTFRRQSIDNPKNITAPFSPFVPNFKVNTPVFRRSNSMLSSV